VRASARAPDGRRRECDPPDHEGPGRSRDAGQSQHELLPRHRRHERRPGRDFEDTVNGGNHPVTGTTAVTSNVWHHAAATYDGTTWNLYLDGVLDRTLSGGAFTPESTSIQHAAIGTAMTSNGTAAGFFQGVVDEARIWSLARTQAQIQAAKDTDIAAPQSGLIGHWGVNEGAGTIANNTFGTAGVTGTLTNGPTWVSGFTAAAPNFGVQLDGTNDQVTFGPAAGLGATTFTLELWFKRTGAGVGTSTGTGGVANAIPLITKGRAEAETPANLNMNYFLGIDATSGVLVGDFEDTVNGGNHPVTGTTAVTSNVWHHAAATYDGTTWNLYLDGVLDRTLSGGAFTPESTSIQHAAIGTAMTSNGTAAGFFQGSSTRPASGASPGRRPRSRPPRTPTSPPPSPAHRTGASTRRRHDRQQHLRHGRPRRHADERADLGQRVSCRAAPTAAPTISLVAPAGRGAGAVDVADAGGAPTDPENPAGPPTVTFVGRPYPSGVFRDRRQRHRGPPARAPAIAWTGRGGAKPLRVVNAVAFRRDLAATSPTRTFDTGPRPAPSSVGCGPTSAGCSSGGDELTAQIVASVQGAVFTLGDNAYDNGLSEGEFTALLRNLLGYPVHQVTDSPHVRQPRLRGTASNKRHGSF
jgi:hypothetical protein